MKSNMKIICLFSFIYKSFQFSFVCVCVCTVILHSFFSGCNIIIIEASRSGKIETANFSKSMHDA